MTDFVIVGGGIAGVSAAAHLAPHGSVTIVEAEQSLAYHTTGRSAALFVENYGSDGSRPLAAVSRPFFEEPPEGSTDNPLLSDRGLLWLANESQVPTVSAIADEGSAGRWLGAAEALELVPVLRPDHIAGALLEPALDIDVAGLHQAFVRIARAHGALIKTDARVTALRRKSAGWEVVAGGETLHGNAVINAAGAWGDDLARLAGVEPVGLQPMRRTAFMVPGNPSFADWPMVVEGDQMFYFKPDGVQLFCSLSEENPDEPHDARPRVEDVALAIDRINRVTTLGIRSVNSQWTGLRTFAPDRELVVGEDPETDGFYWLVGQGGTGIQTSPAYGALLAGLATGDGLPGPLASAGFDPEVTDPARFR